MKWPLYLAFKQLFPTGRPLAFFSATSILGVALGVMVLLIVQSVMNGFASGLRKQLIDINGHIRVESTGHIEDHKNIQARIAQEPEVAAAVPYAMGMGMLEHERIPAFPVIRGFDVNAEEAVIPVEQFLISGQLESLDDSTVFIGSGLAHKLGASIGSKVDLYTPLMMDHLKAEEIILPYELEIGGIFESGWNPVDSNTLIVTLRFMQELYGLDDDVHGIGIRLKPGHNEVKFTQKLKNLLPSEYTPYTWIESHRDFLFLLRLEKTMLFFIILFILVVASFSIASSLIATVVRKTREIGLLSAMGARAKDIALLYCLQGFIIGSIGTLIGILSALLALQYRQNIINCLTELSNTNDVITHFYQFTDLPVGYLLSDFIIVSAFAIIISTLAGLLPAWKISRINPAQALRNE